MNHAILVNNRICLGRQCGAQIPARIKLPGLVKIYDPQLRWLENFLSVLVPRSPSNRRNTLVFSLPFGPTKPTRIPAR